MATALDMVRKFYPEVKTVKDATKDLQIEVTKRDCSSAKVKNHKECAMAVAAKRQEEADGVLVSVSTAYIVKDKVAVRYHLPEAVRREVVSFDRKGGFEEGEYQLKAVSTTAKLGMRATRKNGNKGGGHEVVTGKYKPFIHYTDNIREVLNGKTRR